MKQVQLKKLLLFLLLIIGIGQAMAQDVLFTHQRYRGYQVNSENTWRNFSDLNRTTSSDWIQYGNSSASNGYLGNNYGTFIQRYNTGSWSGDLFDWFYLTFTAPSYSYVTFTVDIQVYAYHNGQGSSMRAAYFDYGTDTYSRWSSYSKDPIGYSDFRTSCGLFENRVSFSDAITQGEKIAAWVYRDGHYSNSTLTSTSVTIDNRTGSGNSSTTRYGGFSSSKSKGGNYEHKTQLNLRRNYSITYYKYITYKANGGTGSNQTQTISSGTLKNSSIFTRKNHIFKNWNTKNDGTGTNYTSGQSVNFDNSNSKGAMDLFAIWTPVQFTLMNGSNQIAQINASETLTQLAGTYKPTAGTNQFFCGYYTQAGGKGIQVYDSNLNPTTAGLSQNFTANTPLYAHFITTQHTATWDYTYRTDHNTYENLNDHNRYCRLQFKDGSGTVLKTVYLTAPEVTNVQNPNSSNHTTSKVVVDLAVGNTSDVTNADNAKIYFTKTQLESMRGYQFDVWTTDGTTAGQKASLWVTTTNASAHTTIFNYGQLSDNMFMLKWNVTLHDLNRFPDKIYAKPMILVNGSYVEIDQMTALIGEDCYKISEVKNSQGELGAGSYATYYGEYPVLKNETGGTPANYKVGMAGFYLAGSNYFLNQNEGKVSDDFVSGNAVTYSQSSENTITYDIYDYQIPVVQVVPANPALGETGATVNYLPVALYVDEARAGSINLSAFHPYRAHFNFLGWYDVEWSEATHSQKIWGANDNYEFRTGTQPYGGTRTIVALWDRDSDPEASIEMTEETDHFKYTITATDDAEVKAVKYLIATETPTAETTGWTTVPENNSEYVVTIPRYNTDYGKNLYILVQNETRSIVIKYDAPIRSFIDIKANPDPDSRVANGHVEGEGENKTWVPDGTYSYTYYSTYYNSEQAFKLNGAVAFKVSELNERAISLTPISPDEDGNLILPKGEAVILSNATSQITLEAVDSDMEPSDDNIFEGVDTETIQSADYDYYIFSYAQKGLGFYLNNSNTLAAHKAFIKLSNSQSNARAFIIDTPKDDKSSDVTGIRDVEIEVDSNTIYDLSGRQVNAANAKGGIYIKGGKKVMIK